MESYTGNYFWVIYWKLLLKEPKDKNTHTGKKIITGVFRTKVQLQKYK